jgi:hypothetical protein
MPHNSRPERPVAAAESGRWVSSHVQAVCGPLAETWEHVKPAEATVEFALGLVARQGKLTELLVEGGGEASLKVTLTCRDEESGKL